MNDVGARAVSTYGGWHGEFRQVHRADWRRVQHNGVDRIFDSADAAEVAAWRVLKTHMFGLMQRDGARATAARTEAENLFGRVFTKRGPVRVERR